jgi:hypothetical protein
MEERSQRNARLDCRLEMKEIDSTIVDGSTIDIDIELAPVGHVGLILAVV